MDRPDPDRSADVARLAGRIVQGIVLGALCLVALLQMLITVGDAVIFRYEGF